MSKMEWYANSVYDRKTKQTKPSIGIQPASDHDHLIFSANSRRGIWLLCKSQPHQLKRLLLPTQCHGENGCNWRRLRRSSAQRRSSSSAVIVGHEKLKVKVSIHFIHKYNHLLSRLHYRSPPPPPPPESLDRWWRSLLWPRPIVSAIDNCG